jgi:hypothetical protein
VETTPHINKKRAATLIPGTVKLSPQKRKRPMGTRKGWIRRVQALPETHDS